MHELSLCRSIYSIVRRAVPDRQVLTITVDVGALRQVVPATLAYCWGIVAQGTALDGSELALTVIEAQVECDRCGARTPIRGTLHLACASCATSRVRVVSGQEFLVRSVDVKD